MGKYMTMIMVLFKGGGVHPEYFFEKNIRGVPPPP